MLAEGVQLTNDACSFFSITAIRSLVTPFTAKHPLYGGGACLSCDAVAAVCQRLSLLKPSVQKENTFLHRKSAVHWYLSVALKHAVMSASNCTHFKQVALVDQLTLALLQLSPQTPQLALILTQQGTLIYILIYPGSVADVLGAVGKLQSAQRLCNTAGILPFLMSEHHE